MESGKVEKSVDRCPFIERTRQENMELSVEERRPPKLSAVSSEKYPTGLLAGGAFAP